MDIPESAPRGAGFVGPSFRPEVAPPEDRAQSAEVIARSFLKRAFDFSLAFVGLLLSSPLWGVVALTIKMEDRGPILYKQERWGRAGTRFYVYKFRTMVAHSDSSFGVMQATENDKRVTRVGRFLRASGIDELPQFINILRGQMSFIGPRALAVGEVIEDDTGKLVTYDHLPGFMERLKVRPGLSGLAVVHMPKDATPLEKFECDLRYIAEQSFLLDLRLVALSLWISVRGKWETRQSKI